MRIARLVWAAPWSLAGLVLGAAMLCTGAHGRLVSGVVEITGGGIGRAAADGRLPFGVQALTLGHVVLASSDGVMEALRAHERVHVWQYERWGLLFVPAYLVSSAWQCLSGSCPYRDNVFEREARRLAP